MAKHEKQELSWLEHCPRPLNDYQKAVLNVYAHKGPSELTDEELNIDFPKWAIEMARTKRTILLCMEIGKKKINGIPGEEIEKCLLRAQPKMTEITFSEETVYEKLERLPRRD